MGRYFGLDFDNAGNIRKDRINTETPVLDERGTVGVINGEHDLVGSQGYIDQMKIGIHFVTYPKMKDHYNLFAIVSNTVKKVTNFIPF